MINKTEASFTSNSFRKNDFKNKFYIIGVAPLVNIETYAFKEGLCNEKKGGGKITILQDSSNQTISKSLIIGLA